MVGSLFLSKENLVLWARSSFNGFAGPGGTRCKAQGIKERISFLFLPCALYPLPLAVLLGAAQNQVLWAWILY